MTVTFELSATERTYARDSAPLTRATFRTGDRIQARDGVAMTVQKIMERDGLLVYEGQYSGTATAIIETDLDPALRFSKPLERLFTYQFDANQWFNLRYETRTHQARLAGANTRGLLGPRVSLISHQVYVAAEVATRFAPRVLLADEVGLGKTIEAGLIMHQQLLTGAAERVLVIVPPALTFQWFVELIRRFNLQFVILGEDRCQAIEHDNLPEEADGTTFNPFEAQQLMICSLDLLLSPERLEQALAADWDLVIVDEAHHLTWTEDAASPAYEVVRQLAAITRGLLLLTATPEQLGLAGHFARLRLLDPARYHDYNAFIEEESSYQATASLASSLLAGDKMAAQKLTTTLGVDADVTVEELVQMLLDRHGTGRVLFRNVRAAVSGFPRRLLRPAPLPNPPRWPADQLFPHAHVPDWQEDDPRINWLQSLLLDNPGTRFLVICAFRETAIAVEAAIRETGVRSTVFHEGMDLVARDRAAAYFAEITRGAQVLVCSEIGSEGRNFQFASHLVMFDLPESPDLLEQRIGRLDRIGQRHDATIHVPYLVGTRHAFQFILFDKGLGLFIAPNPVAQSIYDEFVTQPHTSSLIDEVAVANATRIAQLQSGRDRLLELNSHNVDRSAALVAEIVAREDSKSLEQYMENSFDAFGLESEPLTDGVLLIKPTESMVRHSSVSVETLDHFHYPELPEAGLTCTYNREIALAREDVHFFTWEHPVVQQAFEVLTSDTLGNCAIVVINNPALPRGTLLLEAVFLVDCQAPADLLADRFCPPSVIRRLIAPDLRDLSETVAFRSFADAEVEVQRDALTRVIDSQRTGLEKMLIAAEASAQASLEEHRRTSLATMRGHLSAESARLTYLATVNAAIRSEEIEHIQQMQSRLADSIGRAELRLDAIRIIIQA